MITEHHEDKQWQTGCSNHTVMMFVAAAAPKLSPRGKPCYAEYSAGKLFAGGRRLDTRRHN